MRQGRAGGQGCWLAGGWLTVLPSGPTWRAAGRSVVVCRRPAAAVPSPVRRSVFHPSHSCRPVHICLKGMTDGEINSSSVDVSHRHLSESWRHRMFRLASGRMLMPMRVATITQLSFTSCVTVVIEE